MFKKEVAQRAARVMGNVIREPISKKDHELMQNYLQGPRQLSPQEVDWHVPTQKMTDLTREMRNIGMAGDGYMNFKDVMKRLRQSKGLGTWDDIKPGKDLEKQTLALQKYKAEIPDTSFNSRTIFGQTPLDDHHKCQNNYQYSWKNVSKRWIKEYTSRAGEEPFMLGFHTSIGDLKPEDKISHVRDVSHVNPKGPAVGRKPKAKALPGKRKR